MLGAGGMGEVYRATDARLGREVALKLVRPLLGDGAACGVLCALLLKEARTLAQLSDPGILVVHDVGEHHGCVYVAMELVDGVTLREWASAPRPWRERLQVLLRAGRALSAAHGAGVVHRDVKPDNVMIERSGRVVVTDFGLARSAGDGGDADYACGCSPHPSTGAQLERAVVGTPAYMSPEQHAGGTVDSRADQYGFAVMAWEILFGSLPFNAASDQLVDAKNRLEIAPPPSDTDVPRRLEALLRRGLRASASARYVNLRTFVDELERAAEHPVAS